MPLLSPPPRKIRLIPGRLVLPDRIDIGVDKGFSATLMPGLDEFKNATNQPGKREFFSDNSSSALVRLIKLQSGIPQQGYRLKIHPGGIEIATGEEAGAFYGLQTLRQILLHHSAALPCMEIEDWPQFANRGYMLDISRCKVPKMETLRELIRLLALFKINQLQLYTEHTFAFINHEVVWGDASPITPEDVRRIDEQCRNHFIELVPNLNSFGHFERWLRHPEYKHLAECPDGFARAEGAFSPWGTTLRPDAESLRFLSKLYEEFLPNFSSPMFNIGCDETWELGQGWSKSRADEVGVEKVYFDFLQKICDLARRNGKRIQFWADGVLRSPDLIDQLGDDVTGLIWGYEADHPFEKQCEIFAKTSRDFYVAPGTSSWNSIGGRLDNALANLASAARSGAKFGASGYIITDWGDGGHHQSLPVSYAPIVFGASQAWNPHEDTSGDLSRILDHFVFRDTNEVMGKIWVGIGQSASRFQKSTPNKSPLNILLFSDNSNLDKNLEEITLEELASVCSYLLRLEAEIPNAQPTCPDRVEVLAELRLTINFLLHAARRGIARLSASTVDFTQRRREMILLIHEFERCWLARNRHGGLHESSDRLRKALEYYL